VARKEKGRWITTDEGRRIHFDENGVPDKGNPHVIAAIKSGSRFDSSASAKKADYDDDDLVVARGGFFVRAEGRIGTVVKPELMDTEKVQALRDEWRNKQWEADKAPGGGKTILVPQYKGTAVMMADDIKYRQGVIVWNRQMGMYQMYNKDSFIKAKDAEATMDWDKEAKRFRKRKTV